MEQVKHTESGDTILVRGTVTGFKKSLAGTQRWIRVKIGANEIWVREEDAESSRDDRTSVG